MQHFFVSWFTVLAVASAFPSGSQRRDSQVPVERTPSIVVNLEEIGWEPPPSVSNKTYFKDLTPDKLSAMDYATRVIFPDEDVIVVYHTKENVKDCLNAPQCIEAFFIRASDGSLIATKRWPTALRKSQNDLFDSEARLIALHDGRFLVFASGVITVYGKNFETFAQRKLEPITDMWTAASVDNGNGVFLRGQSKTGDVVYSWLSSDTLEVKYATPGYRGRDFSVQEGLNADSDSVLFASRNGIFSIDRDRHIKAICDDSLCREDGFLQMMSGPFVAWSSAYGFGIINAEKGGLVWSRTIQPPSRRQDFQFGEIHSALRGTKFALWVKANKNTQFDRIDVGSEPTILVYDTAEPKELPTAIAVKPHGSQWDLALSPGGGKLGVFNGKTLQIFSLGR